MNEDVTTIKHCRDYKYVGINISHGGTIDKANKYNKSTKIIINNIIINYKNTNVACRGKNTKNVNEQQIWIIRGEQQEDLTVTI